MHALHEKISIAVFNATFSSLIRTFFLFWKGKAFYRSCTLLAGIGWGLPFAFPLVRVGMFT